MAEQVGKVPRSISQYQHHQHNNDNGHERGQNPPAPGLPKSKGKPANNNKSHFTKPPRTGYFSPTKLHMVESINRDQPSNLDTRTDQQKAEDERIPANYLLINFVYVIWGFIGIGITMVLHLLETDSEIILNFDGSRTINVVPTIFMYISSGLTVFAGIGGTLAFFANFKHFLHLYKHLLWIVLVFDGCSAIFSYASWNHINMAQYARLLEAEAYYINRNDSMYLDLWSPRYKGFWPVLQVKFKCCGFKGVEDWIHFSQHIPESCCRKEISPSRCRREIGKFNSNLTDFSSVEKLIYKPGCEEITILEQKSQQRDWIIFPLIISLFDFLLMIHGTELIFELKSVVDTTHGAHVVREFRKSIWCSRWLRRLFAEKHHHHHFHHQHKEEEEEENIAGEEVGKTMKKSADEDESTSSSSYSIDELTSTIKSAILELQQSRSEAAGAGIHEQGPGFKVNDMFVTSRHSLGKLAKSNKSLAGQSSAARAAAGQKVPTILVPASQEIEPGSTEPPVVSHAKHKPKHHIPKEPHVRHEEQRLPLSTKEEELITARPIKRHAADELPKVHLRVIGEQAHPEHKPIAIARHKSPESHPHHPENKLTPLQRVPSPTHSPDDHEDLEDKAKNIHPSPIDSKNAEKTPDHHHQLRPDGHQQQPRKDPHQGQLHLLHPKISAEGVDLSEAKHNLHEDQHQHVQPQPLPHSPPPPGPGHHHNNDDKQNQQNKDGEQNERKLSDPEQHKPKWKDPSLK